MRLCAWRSRSPGRQFATLLLLAVPFLGGMHALAQTRGLEQPVLVLQTGSTEGYCRLAFSPDGKWLASSADHGPVILWDAATGVKLREFPAVSASITQKLPTGGILTNVVRVGRGGLAFSPDGKYLASSGKSNRDIVNGGTWRGNPLPVPPAIWAVASGKPVGEGSWTVGEDGVAHNPNSPWAPNEVVAWQFTKDEVTARQFTNYFGPAQTISDNGLFGAGITEPRDKVAIEIYEVPSNRKIAALPGTFVSPMGLALSGDGRYLALKCQGYGLEVWDLSTLKLVATLDPKSWTADAEAFSPDGKYLAASGDGDSVHIFEIGTWREIFSESYKQVYGIHELAFSPDSSRLAGVDLKLRMWDVQGLREVYEIGGTPFQRVTALAASPDGQRLAVARGEPNVGMSTEPMTVVELWPIRGGTPQALPKKTYELDVMSFSPDSTKLAASGQQLITDTNMHNGVDRFSIGGDLLLWDLLQNREIDVKVQQGTSVAAWGPGVSFSSDGKKLATGALVVTQEHSSGDDNDAEDRPHTGYARLMIIVDPENGTALDEFRLGRGNALLLAQRPDGQHAVSANEQVLRSWNLVNHKLDVQFQPQLSAPKRDAAEDEPSPMGYQKFGEHYQNPVATALRYTPDGHGVLVAEDKSVLLLDATTGAQLKGQSVDTVVRAFTYSRDGKILASAQFEAAPRLWDPRTLTSRPLESADEDCSAIAFSADGTTVVCGGHTGVILAWDTASGSLLARILRAGNGEWLVVTPEGLFDGTPEGARLAAWRFGNRSFALDRLPRSFRHEGLLQELLSGKRPKPKEDLASTLGALARAPG